MKSAKNSGDCYVPDLKEYSINFTDSGEKENLQDLFPCTICPFLMHTSLPYIYTFSRGGRFPWMALERNKDSVLVRCPNPDGGVVGSVCKEGIKILVRVTDITGWCCFGHKKGDIIKVTPGEDIKVPLTMLDASFAWIFYFASQTSAMSPDMMIEEKGRRTRFLLRKGYLADSAKGHFSRICSKLHADRDVRFKLFSCGKRCRYHKWPKRDDYNIGNFGPKGLCIDLFHLSHLFAMGSIYTYKRHDAPVSFICGDRAAPVRLSVNIKMTRTYILRKFLAWSLRLFGISKEVPELICELVVEEGSDKCPMGHKTGMRFIYNMGRKYELCPASFDNLYFIIHNLLRGGKIPWGADRRTSATASCPDAVSNITFKLEGQ